VNGHFNFIAAPSPAENHPRILAELSMGTSSTALSLCEDPRTVIRVQQRCNEVDEPRELQ
jgi:hypothetical protein